MFKRIAYLLITFLSINVLASHARIPWNQCARNHILPKVEMNIDFSGDEAIVAPASNTDQDESLLREMATCEACCCLVQTHIITKIRNKSWNAKQQCFNPIHSLAMVLKINGDVEEVPNLRVKIPISPTNAPAICSPAKN